MISTSTAKKAVSIFGVVTFLMCQPAILFLGKGVVDELDFWGGTFFLVLFGTVEVILFAWVFGMDKAWEEIHHGADMAVPRIYRFIIKYITPLFLLLILGFWLWQEGIPTMMMKNVAAANRPYVLATRLGLLAIFVTLIILVARASRKYANNSAAEASR